MLAYLVRRLAIALAVALTVSLIGFALLRLSGDLAQQLAGPSATVQEVAVVAHAYGLDRPLAAQYLDWLSHWLHGDLGRSLYSDEPVAGLIAEHVGVTLTLAAAALLLALAVAVPLGVVAAWRAGGAVDRFAAGLALIGQGVPGFVLALVLIDVFGVQLGWLPISGGETPAHFVLPVVVLAVGCIPALLRLTRSGMVDALAADYIRTARAKGLTTPAIVFGHALRNAAIPIVSLAAVQLGFLLGGSVVVESVFALDGLGLLAYQSILRTDFPVVQSILVAIAGAYVVLTLVSDLVNARIDPRVRLG